MSGTSLPALFPVWSLKKKVSLFIFYYLIKFHYLSLLLEVLGHMYIAIISLPVWDVMDLQINLNFLIKSLKDTNLNLKNEKGF